MARPLGSANLADDDQSCDVPRRRAGLPGVPSASRPKEITMTWDTPTATDIRFGFEITMYVAAR